MQAGIIHHSTNIPVMFRCEVPHSYVATVLPQPISSLVYAETTLRTRHRTNM
jgi:hypothetical protein